MIRRAIDSGLPRGTAPADAASGGAKKFRAELRRLGLDYAVAVNSTTNVQPVDRSGAVRDQPCQLKTLGLELKTQGAFRRSTWRQGSRRRAMTAQFARVRVQVGEDEQATLLIEWRDSEHEPANYFFILMAELPPSNKQLVSLVRQRWRMERTYQDLKRELGLDPYKGRSFPGWHHHICVVLACYAFVVAERGSASFPSARRSPASSKDGLSPQGATFTTASSLSGLRCLAQSPPGFLVVRPAIDQT